MFALPQTGPALYRQRVIDGKKLAQQLAAGMSSLTNISDFLLDGAAAIQATFQPGETVGSVTALRKNPPLQVFSKSRKSNSNTSPPTNFLPLLL